MHVRVAVGFEPASHCESATTVPSAALQVTSRVCVPLPHDSSHAPYEPVCQLYGDTMSIVFSEVAVVTVPAGTLAKLPSTDRMRR